VDDCKDKEVQTTEVAAVVSTALQRAQLARKVKAALLREDRMNKAMVDLERRTAVRVRLNEVLQQGVAATNIQRVARGRLSRATPVCGAAVLDSRKAASAPADTDRSLSSESRSDHELAQALSMMPPRGHIQAPLELVPSRFGRQSKHGTAWMPMYKERAEYDGEWRPINRTSSKHQNSVLAPACTREAAPVAASTTNKTPALNPIFLKSISDLGPAFTGRLPFSLVFDKPAQSLPLASATAPPEDAHTTSVIRVDLSALSSAPKIDGVPNELCLKCFDVPCSCYLPKDM
jgi:hypothetical protein